MENHEKAKIKLQRARNRTHKGPHSVLIGECSRTLTSEERQTMFRASVDAALESDPAAQDDVQWLMDNVRNMGVIGASELYAKLGAFLCTKIKGA